MHFFIEQIFLTALSFIHILKPKNVVWSVLTFQSTIYSHMLYTTNRNTMGNPHSQNFDMVYTNNLTDENISCT